MRVLGPFPALIPMSLTHFSERAVKAASRRFSPDPGDDSRRSSFHEVRPWDKAAGRRFYYSRRFAGVGYTLSGVTLEQFFELGRSLFECLFRLDELLKARAHRNTRI